MDIQIALQTLEFTNICEVTIHALKHKYRKLALQHHPDKNGHSIESTAKFQQINAAYNYLLGLIRADNDVDSDTEINADADAPIHANYVDILLLFIQSIVQNDKISKIICELLDKNSQTNKLIDMLTKENAMEILTFLTKYKQMFYIPDALIELVKSKLVEKYSGDHLFLLNPTLDDLLDHNIYKLEWNNNIYYVPLWHNEVYYDCLESSNELIVKCIPDLPDSVSLDEYNNIHTFVQVLFHADLLSKNTIPVHLGQKVFHIPTNGLTIKKEQFYVLKECGIYDSTVKINAAELLNAKKSDIIVKIIFV